MTFIEELILAIIQALLEWLPVSSEGFLILISILFFNGSAEEAFRMAIYFHLGTAISVLIKYRGMYLNAILRDFSLLRLLILATFATGVTAVPLYFFLKNSFLLIDGMIVTLIIGIALLITGTLLKLGRLFQTNRYSINNRKIIDEIGLGIFQGFAILPGISRSGTTVTYLLLRGYNKKDAFTISFLISLPAVVAAIAFDILFEEVSFVISMEYLILTGIVAVIGYLMMSFLLHLAEVLSFDKICYILGFIAILLTFSFMLFF
ncbi:MAG: undecaprenyl-diphosphate phosphatase [Candidatus Asgardarchaeum sp.]